MFGALHKGEYRFTFFILIFLILFSFSHDANQFAIQKNSINNITSHISRNILHPFQTKDNVPVQDISTLSQIQVPNPVSGILNPVGVEQRGYNETGSIFARTDTTLNTEQIMTIDTDHDWVASTAEVDLLNLKRIYAENGTFEEGYPGTNINPTGNVTYHPLGWDANSSTTDTGQTQIAAYTVGVENYVIVENQGTPVGPATERDYQHSSGTNITWTQNATNLPFSEDFILRFRYFYFKGPIGAVPFGNCSIVVNIDGSLVWNMSLLIIEQRGVWYDSGEIPLTLENLSGTFEIEIGLFIDETMILDPNTDYDSDGTIDGIQNTYFITLFFDDFSFESASSPNCDEVDLQFSVDGSSNAIIGSGGTGFSQIENQSYWDIDSLNFVITSNTSVSFTYNMRLLNHRFLNSCWTTDTLEQGIAYTIDSGTCGNLEMYFYLGFLEEYEELNLIIYYPYDWDNIKVYDPFLDNVTSLCICNEDSIIIPETLSDRLGWWKLTGDAPNYASSAMVERFDVSVPTWVSESIFHTYDSARLNVSIGTATESPILSNPVNFTWALPNCTSWEETSNIGFGTVVSAPVIFGPSNTTAGVWWVKYLWTNGSELAYGCQSFELHHTAVLELVFSERMETVVGQPVSVVLRFVDIDNEQLIMNPDVSIVGHWIGPDVEFNVDIVNNWWHADFDTTPVGAGNFTIDIVSYTPCFETDSLQISIYSYFQTSLDTPTGPLTPLVYGRQYSFEYIYAIASNNSGIDDATVEISEEGSEWAIVENTGSGHYNLNLVPMESGDYRFHIKFSKMGFEDQTHVLSFLVNDVEVEVESISNLAGIELSPFNIEVRIVESDTRALVVDANVTLAIYRPGDVLYFDTLMNEDNDGVYSATIPMPSADSGTYTVIISIEKDNHQMVQDFSATLFPIYNINWRIFIILISYSGQIGIIVAVAIVAVMGQRVRIRRRREKHTSAVSFKNRLNDANNILGFIVLHKDSGVPIYSQVFKGGFEEGLLSAFITAIMVFREEIDVGSTENYTLIPISDVMRTVPTENLICAFITMTTPSVEQELKMVGYARAIGMMFDDTLALASAQVIDAKTSRTFEWMFDDFMDGSLIRIYQIGEKKFPKSLRFIENALKVEEMPESFNLTRLIHLLNSLEINPDDIYTGVFRAIEEEFILPIYLYDDELPLDSE